MSTLWVQVHKRWFFICKNKKYDKLNIGSLKLKEDEMSNNNNPKDKKIELAEEILGLTFLTYDLYNLSAVTLSKLLLQFSEEIASFSEKKIEDLKSFASNTTIEHDKKLALFLTLQFSEEELEELVTILKNPILSKLLDMSSYGGTINEKITSLIEDMVVEIVKKLIELIKLSEPSKIN
ncbi:MAG: hypothetical protein CO137_03360 [Candidatus Magasanikbacteria bacterium CG_4_9_14_3_um_filter_32_9]|uniref:Uncharacterized protein n=1 Tax=Candidatus Magasanikbacteria bacterium CG_4_9_14_3_um_filter_32_9 TaxID=1974644 RepID=A0A2M7Z6C0_9BACT|nr:MAG: hypothetical protein CO137_03360 [Candidatus Magasanikbacteria bacterium CG_4_9_14_3_um_filter_32_9]